MARYDQVEPHVGIVRAPLAANLTPDANGELGPVGVALDVNGRVVVGTVGANTGIVGVLVKNLPVQPAGRWSDASVINNWMGMRAGDVVDIMTQGDILDVEGLPAGSEIYAAADGTLSTTNTGTRVGFTVEASRLVVDGK